jgi:hypothetical protein
LVLWCGVFSTVIEGSSSPCAWNPEHLYVVY